MAIAKRILQIAALIVGFSGCSKEDENYIPYSLIGFKVYLYDEIKAPDADYYAGYIPCTYSDREQGLSQARDMAIATARRLKFDTSTNRFYIFCTVTKESDCVTKVR